MTSYYNAHCTHPSLEERFEAYADDGVTTITRNNFDKIMYLMNKY